MEFTQEDEGGVCVLTPITPDTKAGWTATLKTMRNRVNVLTDKGARKFLVDMTNVDFLDSTGIGTLVGCLQRTMSVDGAILYCGFGLRTAETLAVVNLLRVVPTRISKKASLAELEKTRPGKETCRKLAAANPGIDAIRDDWQRRAPKPEDDEPAGAQGGAAAKSEVGADSLREDRLRDSLPPDLSGDLGLWVDALDAMMRAREVYSKAGLKFDVDISFKEFIGRLAEALIDRRSGN